MVSVAWPLVFGVLIALLVGGQQTGQCDSQPGGVEDVVAAVSDEIEDGSDDDVLSALQARRVISHGARSHGPLSPGPTKHEQICGELRNATYPSGKVLCGQEILTYGWGVYNTQCAELSPSYIVQPKLASSVQKAVAVAQKHRLSISYRGSGHTYNCNGFKSGSMNLDMRAMGNTVTYEEQADGSMYARMAPGTVFRDVESTIPRGYSFTHGTCPSVGVMGYHIHGGWAATTASWANESIVSMQVVTADASLLDLDASSTGAEAELWRAMRVAGSSFGIVTSLTIRLLPTPEPPVILLPVQNSLEYLLNTLPFNASFGWVGLARWDQVFSNPGEINRSGWFVQATLNNADLATKTSFLHWMVKNGILPRVPIVPSAFPTSSDNWMEGRYPFPASGVFSRFYPNDQILDVARLLSTFFAPYAHACRYNLGPFKADEQLPIVSVECNTPEAVEALKSFVDKHADVLQPDKAGSGYVNLPLDATRKYSRAYWPQYDELAAIKATWDPKDFFYIENGIHPGPGHSQALV